MNIFASDPHPHISAQWLDDRRVNKMISETTQMLMSNLRLEAINRKLRDPETVAWINHPCTMWARTSRSNFRWLIAHGNYLINEYDLRFGNNKHQNSRAILEGVVKYSIWFPDGPLTEWANCTPFKSADVHTAYKCALLDKWTAELHDGYVPRFTHRGPPSWAIKSHVSD